MHTFDNESAWLRLVLTPQMTNEAAIVLLKEVGLPEDIFNAPFTQLVSVVGEALAQNLKRPLPPTQLQVQIEALDWLRNTSGARMLTLEHPDYPQIFLTVPNPPVAVFALGDISLLSKPTLSFVGTRNPSNVGRDLISLWVMALAVNQNLTLIEGDAEGVERLALKAASRANGGRLVWLSHVALNDSANEEKVAFISKKGLAISVKIPGSVQNEDDWLTRQALLVAATNYFVVVEASVRSRVLGLIRQALDVSRETMAVPGSVNHPLAKGPHRLIKEGAQLVEDVDDILKVMRLKSM